MLYYHYIGKCFISTNKGKDHQKISWFSRQQSSSSHFLILFHKFCLYLRDCSRMNWNGRRWQFTEYDIKLSLMNYLLTLLRFIVQIHISGKKTLRNNNDERKCFRNKFHMFWNLKQWNRSIISSKKHQQFCKIYFPPSFTEW